MRTVTVYCFMGYDRVQHQQFGRSSSESNRFRTISIGTMFAEILHGVSLWKRCLYERFQVGFVTGQARIDFLRSRRQRVNRYRISGVEPKRHCGLQLREGSGFACYCDYVGRRTADLILHLAGLRAPLKPCPIRTKARKRSVTSIRLRTPSRVPMLRSLSNPRILSASSAKPKSAYASEAASRRSSRAEKFAPRSFARFTFFSRSVTQYRFLPVGFRPAPFLFPPRRSFFIDYF